MNGSQLSSRKLESVDSVGVESCDKDSGVERSSKIGGVNISHGAAAAEVRSSCTPRRGGRFQATSVNADLSGVGMSPSLPPNVVADAAEAEFKGSWPEPE